MAESESHGGRLQSDRSSLNPNAVPFVPSTPVAPFYPPVGPYYMPVGYMYVGRSLVPPHLQPGTSGANSESESTLYSDTSATTSGISCHYDGRDDDDEWEDVDHAKLSREKRRYKRKSTYGNLDAKPVLSRSKHKHLKKPPLMTLDAMIAQKMSSLSIDNGKGRKRINRLLPKKRDVETNPRNMLDSTAPKRRGKEREKPKSRKPTLLKKIIMREREKLRRYCMRHGERNNTEEPEHNDEVPTQSATTSCEPTRAELLDSILHCKYYREYCRQALTETIDETVTALLSDLLKFQDRLYHRDPLKAKIRKRMSCGLREVIKYANLGKLKAIIIAPDVERIKCKGGLDDTINQIIESATIHNTFIAFALSRYHLAKICKKNGRVSCVGIFNYDGSQDNYTRLMTQTEEARFQYSEVREELNQFIESHDDSLIESLKNLPRIPSTFLSFRNRLLNPQRFRYRQSSYYNNYKRFEGYL